MMKITNDMCYVGVNDHELDLFEGQFIVPNGMAYNSYVIIDEKIAVMDSVGGSFNDEWLANIEKALNGRKPDYLVIQHMEPDHSANVLNFVKAYPDVKLVVNSRTLTMLGQFFDYDFSDKAVVVADNEKLSLGKHELTFIFAPMVHWPEVMMTYDSYDKILFSADAFGKFGTLDTCEEWACEARRYYFGIVGKYGKQVQPILKRINELQPEKICPLHGPVLDENLEYYINLYNIWSSYGVESEGIMIAYTSVYSNTRKCVESLAKRLEDRGVAKVVLADLAREDMAECVEDAFRYGKLVLATTTYNSDVFPFMKTFIEHLTERGYKNRTVAFIENGSWAPVAAKVMRKMLDASVNLTFAENTVTIKSTMKKENEQQLDALADELTK